MEDKTSLVDGDLCLLERNLVNKLAQIPEETYIGYDKEAFTHLYTTLTEIDRGNLELLRNILLQLNVMMMSNDVCELVHDSHIWVYIMESFNGAFSVSNTLQSN